jgi:hypothetical protein
MGKFIGSQAFKATKQVKTFNKKDKETGIETPTQETAITSGFITVGNRSILVSLLKAYDSQGNEINIDRIETIQIKIASFEGGEKSL